jgi:hypothetical protein
LGRPRATAAVVVLLAAAAALAPAFASAQCAMCKAALESSPDGLGAQFNRAIVVMIVGPYLVSGVVGLVFFRGRLRDASRRWLVRLRRLGSRRAGR